MSRRKKLKGTQLELPLNAPPIKPGSRVKVNGKEMLVYYLNSKFTHIFLMEPGATVAKPYPKDEVTAL